MNHTHPQPPCFLWSTMNSISDTFSILCNYYRMQTEDLQTAVKTDKKYEYALILTLDIFPCTGNKGVGGVTLRCDSLCPTACLDRMRQFS